MKKDLFEIRDIEEKIKNKLDYLKGKDVDINEVKILKNSIYDKASKTFIYNLKKLIQLELTQKNLAKKIGISEDLLSKYKSGEAFPAIETLIYIGEVYNISLDKLIGIPLDTLDLETLENNQGAEVNIFEEKYYVYFLVTNLAMEGTIQEGTIKIFNNTMTFKILAKGQMIKCFIGEYHISEKLISCNLKSLSDGTCYINMLKPNVNKNKYVGGLAMLMLPSDANSKPCAQKILFSKLRLDRELYYKKIKALLDFSIDGCVFGNVKISQGEDEVAYNFIEKIQREITE